MIQEYTDNFGKTWLMADFTISDKSSTSPHDDCGLYSDANVSYMCSFSHDDDVYAVNLSSNNVIIDSRGKTLFWHDLDETDVIDADVIVIYYPYKDRHVAILDKDTSEATLLQKFYAADKSLVIDEGAYQDFLYEWTYNTVHKTIIPGLVAGCSKEAAEILSQHEHNNEYLGDAYGYAMQEAGLEVDVDPLKRELRCDIKVLQPYFDEFCLKNSRFEDIRMPGI